MRARRGLAIVGLWALLAPGLHACSVSGHPARVSTAVTPLPRTDSSPRLPERLFVISIAGLVPEAYRNGGGFLAASPERPLMPELSRLAASGVSADAVMPVTPAGVYPAHASMLTGLSPSHHGIPADRLLGKRGVRPTPYWHASQLQGTSLWQAAAEARMQVVSLGFPSTVGAAISQLVPDIAPIRRGETWLGALEGAATPWIVDRLTALRPVDAPPSWPTAAERDDLFVELACQIAGSTTPPELWLIRFIESGHALRRYGPDSSEARRAFAHIDARLGRLVTCLQETGLLESSAILVVGDSRTQPVHTRVDPNTSLAAAGLLTPDPRSETGIRSWSAIVRSNEGSAFVYAETEADAVLARKALNSAADRTRAFRVVSARELQQLGADPQAWFGLEAAPGFVIGDGATGPVVRAAVGMRGASGYLPGPQRIDVGFVAWGSGLRAGLRIPRMEQLDVAPTAASLLDLRLPDAEGRALVGTLSVTGYP